MDFSVDKTLDTFDSCDIHGQCASFSSSASAPAVAAQCASGASAAIANDRASEVRVALGWELESNGRPGRGMCHVHPTPSDLAVTCTGDSSEACCSFECYTCCSLVS